MKVTRVRLENVRNLEDGEHVFTYPDGRPHEIVLLTGPSASGKTTFLELIAMAKERVASSGRPTRPRDFLRTGASNGLVEITLALRDAERRRFGIGDPIAKLRVQLSGAPSDHDPRLCELLRAYSHSPAVAKLEYFPAQRALTLPLGMEPAPDENTERRLRSSSDHDKYRGVVPWLRAQLAAAAVRLSRELDTRGMVMSSDTVDPIAGFRETLAAMCPWLRVAGLGPDSATPMFLRRDGSSPPIFELSAAEQDAVLLAGTWHRVGLASSLILIDRPDLHADPDDQLGWLRTLAGADNQLLVTAKSERLGATLPPSAQIALRRR